MRNAVFCSAFALIGIWACGSDSGGSSGGPSVDGGASSGTSGSGTSGSGTSGTSGGTSGTSGTSGAPVTANAGKLDEAFGTGGIAKMQPQSEQWDPAGGIVMKDGRVIVVGSGKDSVGVRDIVIGRLTVDGKPDAAAGANASVKYVRAAGTNANVLAPIFTKETDDGSIFYLGSAQQGASAGTQGYVELRKPTDGSCVGNVFKTAIGCYRTPNSTLIGENPEALGDVFVDAAGNAIVAGSGRDGKDFVVQKLKAADGFPDNAFGDTTTGVGLAHTDLGGVEGIGHIEVAGDGSILAFGVTTAAANPGVVVVAFSATGAVGTKTPLNVPAERWVKTADGKILVAAKAGGQTAFARILPTGALDTTFGMGGKATAAFTPKGDALLTGLAVLSDGRIIVGYSDFSVGRFTANGALDPTWNATGFAAVTGLDPLAGLTAVGVQPGDKVVAIGGKPKSNDSGTDKDLAMFAARFQN